MELEQLRNLSDDELEAQAKTAGEQLFRIRFQKSLGNLEGLKNLRAHKLEIARVKTLQRQRAIAALATDATPAPAGADEKAAKATSKKAKKA